MLDERGHCKISDLGLAVISEGNNVKGYAGTPGYTAPEVVLNFEYNYVVDFFSLGVIIYRFLCGRKPFQDKKSHDKRRDTHRRVKQNKQTNKQKWAVCVCVCFFALPGPPPPPFFLCCVHFLFMCACVWVS